MCDAFPIPTEERDGRASAHGAMGRRINPSRWPINLFSHSIQCSTIGVTKAEVSVMVHVKDPLLLIGKSNPCSGDSRFPLSLSDWFFIIYSTPYNRLCKIFVPPTEKIFMIYNFCSSKILIVGGVGGSYGISLPTPWFN